MLYVLQDVADSEDRPRRTRATGPAGEINFAIHKSWSILFYFHFIYSACEAKESQKSKHNH